MKVYEDLSAIDNEMRGAVLAVGNFDGVHLGHQRILRTAHALAQVSSGKVLAMTFEPHPLAILRPDCAPPRLTPWNEKLRQLIRVGVDAVVCLRAGPEMLSLSAEDFVRQVLVRRIHPSYIVEGPDFGFGRNRQGDIDTLRALSPKGGFQVHVVEPYRLTIGQHEHVIVSSTLIRECVSKGKAEHAAACLGRSYALVGRVVHGEGQGHKLGFPTINLEVAAEQLIPAEGVYAGIAELYVAKPQRPDGAGGSLPVVASPAAVSIGHRPTLGGGTLVVEAFLLDKAGDWYGDEVRLGLAARVRDQRKFDDRQSLTEQIARDVEAVRKLVTIEPGCGF